MSNVDLEKLYSPSQWVIRMAKDQIVEKHTELTKSYSNNVINGIPHELNIPYGELDKEKIDIFGTDLPKESPLLVFVHGGYWQEQSLIRSIYYFIAKNMYKNQIKTIFVGYELAPKVTISQIISEIETATRKCIDYAKKQNSKGLYLTGYSVGAHLVAMLSTRFIDSLPKQDQELIKAIIMLGGIYDLQELPKTTVNIPLNLNENSALALSPLKQQIIGGKTAFHVVAAENDSPVFKQQALEFYDKLKKLRVDAHYLLVKDVDHFDLTELLFNDDYELTKYLVNLINNN